MMWQHEHDYILVKEPRARSNPYLGRLLHLDKIRINPSILILKAKN